MKLITIDFETYYDKEYSLSKMTTEEYVRDERFEVIGVSIKVNNEATEWASGTRKQIQEYLNSFDWEDAMVLAHNTMFDGAILSWLFGIRPRVWTDTLCIARSIHGTEVGGSLKALAERYGVGAKGTEVVAALGKRRLDFTPSELSAYGDYCVNDVELTYRLFGLMSKQYPVTELKIIDLTLRMFIEPMLELDKNLLVEHLEGVKQRKQDLLDGVGKTKKELMSNPKFAELLQNLGVIPPIKLSKTTGLETFAFAKTDEDFKALQEHDDDRVQALVAARLGTKSTLEETRTERFIAIAERGKLPVPVRYYAAHTGRWGGDDKINLQNLPSRGPNGKKLKSSIIAPDGYMLIDCDSSQIEARVLAWLAGQTDLVMAFHNGDDVYKKMAMSIYDLPDEELVTKDQRFVGKTTILGAGYGMGAVRFREQLKTFGHDMELEEARRVIDVYRRTNVKIKQLWNDCQSMLKHMVSGEALMVGEPPVLRIHPEINAIRLPSKLFMRYDGLQKEMDEQGKVQYSYYTRRGRKHIYGGKVVENLCQAIARCIIAEQMLKISNKYRVVLTVHDSIVCCVPEDEVQEARSFIEGWMRWVPDWAKGLPVNCESGIGKSYGECE
jgi:DNA polymerase